MKLLPMLLFSSVMLHQSMFASEFLNGFQADARLGDYASRKAIGSCNKKTVIITLSYFGAISLLAIIAINDASHNLQKSLGDNGKSGFQPCVDCAITPVIYDEAQLMLEKGQEDGANSIVKNFPQQSKKHNKVNFSGRLKSNYSNGTCSRSHKQRNR